MQGRGVKNILKSNKKGSKNFVATPLFTVERMTVISCLFHEKMFQSWKGDKLREEATG
jgi:hypothetical protein